MKCCIKKIIGIAISATLLNGAIYPNLRECTTLIDLNVSATVDIQKTDEILNNVLNQLANTVSEPQFGTNSGEWSVLCLARGNFYDKDSDYFNNYYERIVETVNETASSVNKNGALHKVKSTENSRLILALSSIGKNVESVGDWNLIEPYNDFSWIKKQGINGVIFGLIALDTVNYQTSDATIRQQCVDYLLGNQLSDGGWTLSGNSADPDITAMTLQALSKYTESEDVANAVNRGVDCLSSMQNDDGGYSSWGTVNSESIAQVIVACTSLGINPDSDERFIKNGKSVVDAMFNFYDENTFQFCHIIDGGADAMATDQCTYALIAFERFLNGENSLYDMSDVEINSDENSDGDNEIQNTDELIAKISVPSEIGSKADTSFRATVSILGWDNDSGYKLMDCIINIPDELDVTDVTASDKLDGGQLEYYLEEDTGKLRIVYFNPQNSDLVLNANQNLSELFSIGFKLKSDTLAKKININISGMSLKYNSNSFDETSMTVINTDNANAVLNIVNGISFSAVCLYQGDDVDIIPSSKKAVAIAVTELDKNAEIIYNDGENSFEFMYNQAISDKTGISSYIALVNADIDMKNFAKLENYIVNSSVSSEVLTFGDTNNDGVINAQDALNSVDVWLRKKDADDKQILSLNVNGDSRVNTFDALGISELFVNGTDFGVVEKATVLSGE